MWPLRIEQIGSFISDHLPRRLVFPRLRPTILDRYILKEILIPYFVFLFAFTALLVALSLQKGLTELLSKGVSPLLILSFLKNVIIENLKITIPVSGLFGGILASGRLSTDSEVTAMRAAGISFPRIYVVFIAVGFASMFVLLAVHLWFAPRSAKERKDFEKWVASYYSLAMITPGRFRGNGDNRVTSTEGEDIYAASNQEGRLRTIQIRRWYNELDPVKSPRVTIGDKTLAIGNGKITQIVHADSGEMLKRRLPDGTEQRFLRLKKGFVIEFRLKELKAADLPAATANPAAIAALKKAPKMYVDGVHYTDFRDGYLDYTIIEPEEQFGGIDTRPDIYTIEELIDRTEKIKNGGFEINIMDMLGSLGTSRDVKKRNSLKGADAKALGVFKLPSLAKLDYYAKAAQLYVFSQGKIEMPGAIRVPAGFDKLTFSAMLGNLKDRAHKTYNQYRFEIQHRVAAPFSALLFFFVSFPLGLVVKRAGKSMSFVLALAVLVAYFILEGSLTRMAYTGGIDPVSGAWLANLILFGFGIWLMSSRTEGFAPLRFLGTPFRWLGRRIKNELYVALRFVWEQLCGRFPSLERRTARLASFWQRQNGRFRYKALRLYVFARKKIKKYNN